MASKRGFGVGFLLLSSLFVVIWGLLAGLKVLWAIIKHPVESFKKSVRDVAPACLTDLSLGSHEYVHANGLKFHCVRSGERSKPLMLLLHGFPEVICKQLSCQYLTYFSPFFPSQFWYSWRYQIPEFNKHYHVVAIDLRGYGETDRPPRRSDYTLDKLTEDIVQLIPALGYSRCVLVGHDWGGAIAWSVAHRHPEVVEKLIVLNCPHTSIMVQTLASTWAQFMKSWYILMFQVSAAHITHTHHVSAHSTHTHTHHVSAHSTHTHTDPTTARVHIQNARLSLFQYDISLEKSWSSKS